MKIKLACLILVFFVCSSLVAQTTAFTASWPLGTAPLSATVSGNITADTQALGNYLKPIALSYNQSALTGSTSPTTGYIKVANGTPYLPQSNAYDTTCYVEYRIRATGSNYLKVSSLSLIGLGGSTGTAVIAAYYSTNGFATYDSLGLATSNAVNYNATFFNPVKLIAGNSTTAFTEAQLTTTFAPYGDKVIVEPGKTLTVRVYVWITGTGNRYLFLKNIVVSGITSPTVLLPVSFSSVNGALLNSKTAKISWQVGGEINTAKYDIEKSTTSYIFNSIGNVQANNSSSYSWLDVDAERGNNFYRIKAVDKDGSFTYSPIVLINNINTTTIKLSIAPNPIVDGKLNAQFSNIPKGSYLISLLNTSGQIVYTRTVLLENGTNSLSMQLPASIKAGVYKFSFSGENFKDVKNLLVQ